MQHIYVDQMVRKLVELQVQGKKRKCLHLANIPNEAVTKKKVCLRNASSRRKELTNDSH